MGQFENPFSKLVRREYNVTNLKKILDTFPTSLSVRQLTSNELLERLRELLADKDIRIEELLAQLRNQNEVGSGLDEINQELDQLRQSLQLGDTIEQALENTVNDSLVNSLENQGYNRISGTPLFAKAEGNPTSPATFHIDHTSERDNGTPLSDLTSPQFVTFYNVSDTEDVWVKKVERWTDDSENFFESYGSENPFDGNPFAPTNAWKFVEFPTLHETAVKIPAGTENFKTNITLGYRSTGEYKEAGLQRSRGGLFDSNDRNTWNGFMNLRAKVGNSDGIDNQPLSSIGDMELYRDYS